jgi:hypothetical protein
VWAGAADSLPAPAIDVVRDLAYDLDFFEPNSGKRAEDPAFYGVDRLDKEIREALSRLAELGVET